MNSITKIKISACAYEDIKKTSIHHRVERQGEIGGLHPSKWVALSSTNSILIELPWHIMALVWNMMEMS
jgi:hypothetical protein